MPLAMASWWLPLKAANTREPCLLYTSFKVFGDSTRVKILYVLFESELCVNDIAQCLNMTPSAVSHQLRILKNSKLANFRREGKAIFYSLDDEHVRSMIALGLEHISE